MGGRRSPVTMGEGMGREARFSVVGKPSRWQRPGQTFGKDGKVRRFSDPDQEAAKKTIATAARLAWKGWPATGPVILRVNGIFGIPTSWPEATRQLALNAEVMHVADPDLDQLVKLVQDALVGIVYVDDNQVCGYPNPAKRYGSPERTEVVVVEIDQPTEAHKTPGQRRLEKEIAQKGWPRFLADRATPKSRSKTQSRRRW
jgi:Holliday junction resolvase RusA-like endonuclease